jgi:hypothetical protein
VFVSDKHPFIVDKKAKPSHGTMYVIGMSSTPVSSRIYWDLAHGTSARQAYLTSQGGYADHQREDQGWICNSNISSLRPRLATVFSSIHNLLS